MTTAESFSALKAVEAEENPFMFTKEEWHTFTEEQKNARYKQQRIWEEERQSRYMQAVYNIVPEVGLPCTIVYWSDKRAATVTRIISPTKIEVMHNEVECLDYYAGNYKVLPEINEHMGVDIFSKRRNGQWVMEWHKCKDGVKLMLHYQRHYIDPSY